MASSATPTNTIDAAALTAAAVDPIPEGKPGWKSTPKEQNGFYVVLDGLCSKLAASRAGKDVVIHYGGYARNVFDTNERAGAASFIGLKESGLESIGDPHISSPTGVAGASLEEFWIADSTGSRTSEGAVLHRRSGTTWKTYAKDQTNLHAWIDGGIIGTGGMAMSNGALWVEGSTTKPPASMTDDLTFPILAAFPSGDVMVIAPPDLNATPRTYISRTWSPKSGGVKQQSLAFLGAERPELIETAPDEIYLIAGTKVARYDGAKWKLLNKTKSPIKQAWRAASDEIWAVFESGGLVRSTPKGFVSVATPEPIASVSGIDLGAPWAVAQSGKLYKRSGESWVLAPLPAPAFSANATPAFKAKSVLVVAPDDVLVIAMYWEKGLGWKEQELHTALLRTKAPKETLRCNEPDPENNNIHLGEGFQSWPPMVLAANASTCTTPFTVLARKSKAIKAPPGDWPKIRSGLKGHPELSEVKLIEFTSGDRTFVGAKAKDFESAKKIAELAVAKDRLRPEIVCGEPPTAMRTLPIDLTTGNVIP